MNKSLRTARIIAALTLGLVVAPAWSQWELDNERSAVNFISTKNASIAESHSFGSLLGYIDKAGSAQLTIELDSVETLIPIRNERMREALFETVKFPLATMTVQVATAVLQGVAGGGLATTEVQVAVSLHGQKHSLSAPVMVIGEQSGTLRVVSTRPVLVSAKDFGLDSGIATLQALAGLNSISTAVPVTVNLVFEPAD